MNRKYKYLIKNIGTLTIANFGTKILSFFLIPLYTNILTTGEYGTYDLYSTTISLLIPILTFSVIDATLRYSLESDENKSEVFTIALKRIILSTLIVIAIILINNLFNFFEIFKLYSTYFIMLYFSEILYSLLSNFSRGLEKIKEVAIAGIINSIVILTGNILLLVVFKQGLKGYFVANILGYIIPIIYFSFILKIWNYINLNKVNKKLKNEMFTYSKPLIFNTIGWWITNVSDRYVVTIICGISANGVYSVSYKIPSILNVFQTIFNQAWTLSAVKEYDKNSKEFYSKVYKIYNLGMVLVCSLLIIGDQLLAKLLYSNNFYEAWKYAPFLMISVVFGALSGLLEGVFVATKDTKAIAKTTIIGAIVNTILNIILVKCIGTLGAAIATLISYLVVWILRIIDTNKVMKMDIDYRKNVFSYILLTLQSITLLINLKIIPKYTIELAIFNIICITYFKDIKYYLKKIGNRKIMKNDEK